MAGPVFALDARAAVIDEPVVDFARAITVLQTGSCPPAPPDIPAHPCSLGQYLVRMTIGIWALMGHLLTWAAWFAANFVLWGVGLFGVAFYRSWRSQ